LVGKLEGKRPFDILRRTLEDNIKIDFREFGWEGVDWVHVAQDKDQLLILVNTEMNLRLSKKAGNFLTN
jgi:hypothetical protein